MNNSNSDLNINNTEYSDDNLIELNISDSEDDSHVTKKEIIDFFNNLKAMPTIDVENLCHNILNKKVSLPKFKFEEYFIRYSNYTDKDNQNMVIIHDTGSNNYYYIVNEKVFVCEIHNAQNKIYGDIAKEFNQNIEYIHDLLLNKLGDYQSIVLACEKSYLSTLDEFIDENIYMFDADLKEKKSRNKSKLKIK